MERRYRCKKNTQDVNVFIPLEKRFGQHGLLQLKGLAQAKIIKKSVILFRVLNMTI